MLPYSITGSLRCLPETSAKPSAFALAFVMSSHAWMQDELALTRQDLRNAQQQLLIEAAKQEPRALLVKAYEDAICNLTAREERLMATGEQSFQLACHAVVKKSEC